MESNLTIKLETKAVTVKAEYGPKIVTAKMNAFYHPATKTFDFSPSDFSPTDFSTT